MKPYTQTQSYKLLSAFGGPDSIIETEEGAFRVCQPKEWKYINANLHTEPENQIHDDRLLQRLRQKGALKDLKSFYVIPSNTNHPHTPLTPNVANAVAKAVRFPSFHYCRDCSRLGSVEDWIAQARLTNVQIDHDKFELKCTYCKNKPKLEQTNLVMASKSGDIRDLPWKGWYQTIQGGKQPTTILPDAGSSDSKAAESGTQYQIIEDKCCDKQDLTFESRGGTGFANTFVGCKSCRKEKNLSDIGSLVLVDGVKRSYRILSRSANSLYYPVMAYSLRLPSAKLLSEAQINEVRGQSSRPAVKNLLIMECFKERHKRDISDKEMAEIEADLSEHPDLFVSELDYRKKEYRYLEHGDEERDIYTLKLKRHEGISDVLPFLTTLAEVRRLSMVSVQLGYTRLEAYTLEDYLLASDDDEGVQQNPQDPTNTDPKLVKIQPISTTREKLEKYLPAVESFGEGIFLSFDHDKITKWALSYTKVDKNKDDLTPLLASIKKTKILSQWHLDKLEEVARFLLIHTISHLLIKALEYNSGYPATSLKERLYISPEMSGVLIYAIGGSEGTYGGLVSQGSVDNIKFLFDAAYHAASDCSSDPVCFESNDQGVEGLNRAACFSCSLLPETSCEVMNGILDRRVVLDFLKGNLD